MIGRRKAKGGTLPDFIIFGSGNYNSLGVLHCMAAAGVPAFLLIVGSGRSIFKGEVIRYSRHAHHCHCVASEQQGLDWLLDNRNRFPQGTVVYPTGDSVETLLDLHYDQLRTHFRFPNAGEQGRVTMLMEKDRQTDLTSRAGIPTLWSLYTTHPDFDRDAVTYPCMVKPLMSITGQKGDMRVCHDRRQLDEALDRPCLTRDFIVQQYIANEQDLLFLGVSLPDGTILLPALVRKPGVSSTGEYTHATVTSDIDSYLPQRDAVERFIADLRYVGPFSIEFGVERGQNYFFEINLRNDGTAHYPLAAGLNLPYIYYLHSKLYTLNSPLYTLPSFEYEMIDEWFDLRSVLSRQQTFRQWLHRLLHARAHRWYVPSDPLPALLLLPAFLRRSLQKLRR